MTLRNIHGTPSRFNRFASRVKNIIKRTPQFSSSANYWEDRYRRGGGSGSGSYNRLAIFKAEVLNEFVVANRIDSVIEFGSGDGAQLELADYPSYIGVDVSLAIVQATRRRFAGHPSIRLLHTSEVTGNEKAELALSLDVIYHLVEDTVFNSHMRQLFNAATRFVIIYSSNDDDQPSPSLHVRHRKFTRWLDDNQVDFDLVKEIPNRYPYSAKDPCNTSFADFYVFARPERCRLPT